MKKWQSPQDVYNKDSDQTVPPQNPMLVFIQPEHVLLILTREFLITKHLINCLLSFSAALLSGEKWELTQIFDLLNCR